MSNQSPYRTADPLGPVVSEYPVAGVQQKLRIALGLFCLVVAIDCVWLGMWPRFGEIHWGAFFATGIIALVFFWLSWDAFSQYVKARRQRVSCHEHGLRIHDPSSHQDIRFSDVRSVGGVLWQPPGTTPRGGVMWLDDNQGRRLELPTPIAKADDLGETIRGRTFEQRRDAAEACISSGERARFGRVTLGDLVLTVDGDVLSRSAIERAIITERWFQIKAPGHNGRLISTEEIADLDVLLALIGAKSG